MAIKAVLWDVDDTISDYTGADRAGALDHLAAEGLLDGYDDELALAEWRAATDLHYGRFLAGELSFQGQRRERARTITDRPLADADADAWFDRYLRRYEASWRLFPDVLAALDVLTPKYRHGIMSNSSLVQQDRKLQALRVRERFEVVVCSDDIGYAKPDPEAFLSGCRALGLAASEVAYVGDKLDVDAAGADAAGLFGIWLDRTDAGISGPVPQGQVNRDGLGRITSLAGLPDLLDGKP